MATRCVNDTDGDGNCAACARNPQAPCRQTPEERLLGAVVRGMDSDCVDWLAAQKARQLIADYTRQLVRQQAEEWSDELKTRFAPELRATDQWVDGWLSAADYIGEKPGPKP